MKSITKRTLGLALSLTPGIGAKTIVRIFTRNQLLNRSHIDFAQFNEEILQEEYGFPQKVAFSWVKNKKDLYSKAIQLEERLDRLGVHMITAADALYPSKLEEMDANSPGVLFVYGNIRLFQIPLFAVMSSRNSCPESLKMISNLTDSAIQNGEVLVSGHSTPEYQQAAIVPLRWGAPRVLILDQGLFPALGDNLNEELFNTARLWRYEFDSKIDLVISPVNPNMTYFPTCNKIRDRLVASLSNRIDFVKINPKGNMKQLALNAIRIGKTVRISHYTENVNEFIKQGAQLIDAKHIDLDRNSAYCI